MLSASNKAFFAACRNKSRFSRCIQSFGGIFRTMRTIPRKRKTSLELFARLAKTGRCEFLAETYYHSLSYLFSKQEFAEQIHMQMNKVKELFGHTPKIFRNTELIYRNDLGEFIRQMGFHGVVAEGWDHYLHGSSPHYVRQTKPCDIHSEDKKIAKEFAIQKRPKKHMPMLLKSYQLSDDVAFRFSNQGWKEWPLTADKYASWLDSAEGETINLFMDYETIGEHQWEDTGIFYFFEHLPEEVKSVESVFGLHQRRSKS
jgi:alpha-amylase